MEEEAFMSIEQMWVLIPTKPYSLHDYDKRDDGIDPAIEWLSFAVDQKIEGKMAPSR